MGLGLRGLQGPGGIGGPGSPGRPYAAPSQGGLTLAAPSSGGGLGRGPSGSGGGGGMSVGSGLNYAGKAANLAGYSGAGGALGLAGGLYGLASGKEMNPYQMYQLAQQAQTLAATYGSTAAGAGTGAAAGAGAGTGAAAGTAAASMPAAYFMGPIGAMIAYSGFRDATEQKNMFEGGQRTYDRLVGMGVDPRELNPADMFKLNRDWEDPEVMRRWATTQGGGESGNSSAAPPGFSLGMNTPYWDAMRASHPEIDQQIGMSDLGGDFMNVYGNRMLTNARQAVDQAQPGMRNGWIDDNSGGG